ncbi:MAG: hypothetical protein GX762_06050 [Bacteroidales bacterium]|jgi:hypothetical protein|nr:hypothetical protein [Bacteroidales bacterium]
MNYSKSYIALKKLFTSSQTKKDFDTIELHDLEFESASCNILPGIEEYKCNSHNVTLKEEFSFYTEIGTIDKDIHIKDISVEENQSFKYQIIKPKGVDKVKKAVFLFHGFNEKDWTKYLPWAKAICDGTGSAVILFPIAFHMQRAPKNWSNKREMYRLSEQRKEKFPNIVNSTLSNVAISMRLHAMPQRFIWSGLQTYYDVIQLIDDLKKGNNKHIHKDLDFDIFAYSIGGFLAQILKLTNYKNYFENSKVCLFCSGATFNRLSPVSKFILDSEANVALYSYLVEHFDKMLERDNVLHHFIKEDHLEGKTFSAMLDYQKMRPFREKLLKKYEHQIYGITLTKDEVIPSFEVMNTLQGAYRDINIRMDEMDFEYDYIHENPFPTNVANSQQVDECFEEVFNKVCAFLNR